MREALIVLVEAIGLRAEYWEYHRNHVYERSWACAQARDGSERHPQRGTSGDVAESRTPAAFGTGARPDLITFDTELRLVCAPSLRDHFAEATVSQSFKTYEGKPLAIPVEAAGPKPEYLEWHRREVFGK